MPLHDVYPAYPRPDRIADGIVHALGIVGSITGVILLVALGWAHLSGEELAGIAIYATAIIAAFIASGLYHMTPWENLRPTFRRYDHATIFLKIAGTYTPLVVLIGSVFSYVVLGVVWALALFGAARKIYFWRNPATGHSKIYLALGWMSVLLIWAMFQSLPLAAAILVVAGGLIYSAGVWVYANPDMRFSQAIWHSFVLAGSGCFFAAISVGALA
ncbi:PAQR family membrane homeostasis protein TrhA [Aestuariibius insulae]|uniref:PAQR family membrane homeostasis protein TrhA n=1 Tax=Aestuariibius insulae TaxID=2058287 RepID=UPI00345EDA0A